MNSDIKSVIR